MNGIPKAAPGPLSVYATKFKNNALQGWKIGFGEHVLEKLFMLLPMEEIWEPEAKYIHWVQVVGRISSIKASIVGLRIHGSQKSPDFVSRPRPPGRRLALQGAVLGFHWLRWHGVS